PVSLPLRGQPARRAEARRGLSGREGRRPRRLPCLANRSPWRRQRQTPQWAARSWRMTPSASSSIAVERASRRCWSCRLLVPDLGMTAGPPAVDLDRVVTPDRPRAQLSKAAAIFKHIEHVDGTYERIVDLLGQLFQPGRHIDRVTYRRVVVAGLGADVANHRIPRVQPDPNGDGNLLLPGKLGVQARYALQHVAGREKCRLARILQALRRT